MNSPLLSWSLRADLLAGAAAVSVMAAFVTLSLLRGVAEAEPAARWRRLISASLSLGIGVWSAHFIMLSGEVLPGAPGYDAKMVAAAFAASMAAAVLAQVIFQRKTQSPAHLFGAAVALGISMCAAPTVGLLALQVEPDVVWDRMDLVAALLLGSIGSGAALILGCGKRIENQTRLDNQRTLAALLLGATLVAVDIAVIGSARLPVQLGASHPGQVSIEGLSLLALFGAPAVLALLLLSLLLEQRFRELLVRAGEELKRASYTDALTSLPNRLLFEERLQRAAQRADRAGQRLALLFVNLDGMKGINESFGQSSGDALLRVIGERLHTLAGPALLARAGGDEFLLLLEEDPSDDEVARRAVQLREEIARPCRIEQRELAVSGSIGIAIYPEHGALSRLIPNAAAALNAAKHLGGATYCFFEAGMVAGKREEHELLRDLRCAVERRELELYYQPKIHAPSGQITGVEALMRWHHPRRGMIHPLVFIPIAERYGLISAVGNWLIEDVCRQIRAWRKQGLRMRVAINLSVHQLHQPDLALRIDAALQRQRLEPRVLTCEITESLAMDDNQETLEVIAELAAIGVHLSIDDFGTGYSNLSCLRKLPAEELKIDRGFVLDLETSEDARAIVDAVVKLAQAIGLKVVAEGVETEEQREILRQLGCHELQGFLFAKPMSARALARWALNRDGPGDLDFRASLFGETQTADLV